MTKNKEVKVIWKDAVSYYNFEDTPKELTTMETVGELIKDEKEYIYLKDPKTKDYNPHRHRGVRDKENTPTYLFIPRGMVESIHTQ